MSESVENLLHLIKLCVGAESIDDLRAWMRDPRSRGPDGARRHVTRMWPRQEAALLAGGSLYWVIRGEVLCRQRILRLDEVNGEDGIRRCGIVLDEELVPTAPTLRRPFQGWRYLRPQDAPPDLTRGTDTDDSLPPALGRALAEIGVI